MSDEVPEFRESSLPKILLLQGSIYREETKAWRALEANLPHISDYFAALGLTLVHVPDDGYAYLSQMDVENAGVPVLVRRSRLSLEVTALGVVLRDALSEHDGSFETIGLPTITRDKVRERLEPLLPQFNDDRRREALVERAIKSAIDLGLLRETDQTDTWEIRRIVKARFSLDVLDDLRGRLRAHSERTTGEGEGANGSDEA